MRPARSHAVRPHGGIRHNVSLFLAGLLALFILAGTVYLALLATDSRPVALRRPLLRSNAFHRQERVLREGTENNTPAGDVPQRLLKFEGEELHKAMRLSEITVEALSWKPRVFRLHRLLTSDECDELVDLGRPGMEASTVVDMATGGGLLSSVRTSTGTFLTNPTPLTTLIRSRIAHITMLPEENQEAISILRYKPGQFYKPHQDWFADQTNINRGGQRTATVLIYLTDVEGGGQTIFPQVGTRDMMSDCGGEQMRGLAVEPRKGDAVLFWTAKPNAAEDGATLHGGCTVTAGEKWSATIWIRSGKFT